MTFPLPQTASEFWQSPWELIAPHYHQLIDQPLVPENLDDWLSAWTRLHNLVAESDQRLQVATAVDTRDQQAQRQYQKFLDEILPQARSMDQQLKLKLLESQLTPDRFEIPLRNLRAEVDLFRESNLPLLSTESKLVTEYSQIAGAQTVVWDGKEVTPQQLSLVFQETDRHRRERAWRLVAERQLEDRPKLNQLWDKFLALRREIAANAGRPDYRAYKWQEYLRFDYTPQDCERFHQAIEAVVVPAAQRIYERHRQHLGVEHLRPWDLDVDSSGRPALRPFQTIDTLIDKVSNIFHQVDEQLGAYFEIMRREGLLDLENRKSKAPGGFCSEFNVVHRPFIFMNAVGLQDDVQTLLHEGGHAFHVFETRALPYHLQTQVGIEFAEVASMGMELLASPYLTHEYGGFYSPGEAARARISHLEQIILFWPYMAVVDAFQHWVYTHPEAAVDPQNCDACWADLWGRYMRGVDWSGLETEMETGWHRKLHIFQFPFYYVEYGIAQLGAVQVWRNALRDQAAAVKAYRQALALGGTVTLPALFKTAGAKFALDAGTLQQAVNLIEGTIGVLERIAA